MYSPFKVTELFQQLLFFLPFLHFAINTVFPYPFNFIEPSFNVRIFNKTSDNHDYCHICEKHFLIMCIPLSRLLNYSNSSCFFYHFYTLQLTLCFLIPLILLNHHLMSASLIKQATTMTIVISVKNYLPLIHCYLKDLILISAMTPNIMIFLFAKHILKCSIFMYLCDQFSLLENYSNFAVSMRNPILTNFGNLQEGFIIALKLQEKLVVYDSYDKEIKTLISLLLYNYCNIENDYKVRQVSDGSKFSHMGMGLATLRE